jgi:DNA-binding HxlR family transcriptional regulator
MKHTKDDTLRVIFEPYVLNILRSLIKESKRFNELRKEVKTKRTLSLKLSKLLDYGLIELVPLKTKGRYANYYKISDNGKKILEGLKRI